MEYIDGIEYNDRFISDKALDVLDTLSYFQLVGSYKTRNKIIFEYEEKEEEKDEYYTNKKYRVNTDDITKEIVHFLLKIDDNIFNLVIKEFNKDEEKKYYGSKYPTYAKCFYWDERIGLDKKRDENFIQITCDAGVWKEFVKISRHRDLTLEDIFKIAIDRFLEKRYDLCLQELRSDNSGAEKVYVME